MTQDASIILKLRMEDEATRKAKEASEKIQLFFKGAAENARDSFVKSFDVVDSGLVTIVGEVKRLEKAFGDSFFTINDEIANLSDSILSKAKKIVESIDSFPKAFAGGFKSGFEEAVKGIETPLLRISKFGSETAKDLNKSFGDYFFNAFKGHTVSMSSLWASFAESMKSNFLKALADMASAYVTSTIFQAFKGGLNILGFSGGGVAGEDGPAFVQAGELIVRKSLAPGVQEFIKSGGLSYAEQIRQGYVPADNIPGMFPGIGDATGSYVHPSLQPGFVDEISGSLKSLADGFKEMFPGLFEKGAGLAAAVGGIGASFLNDALFAPSFAATLGGTAGSIGGSLLAASALIGAGPLGILAGSFLGGVAGGGIGSLFGGERLNADEQSVGTIFKQLQDQNQFGGDKFSEFSMDMAVARLRVPDAGADSVHDAFKQIAGRVINESEVDGATLLGFRQLIEKGYFTREQIESALAKDLSIFKGRFAAGLDFVPYDNFPALLHYGERVLTESDNRRMSDTAESSGVAVEMLGSMKQLVAQNANILRALEHGFEGVQTMLDRVSLHVKVVTVDMEQVAEYVLKVFNRRMKSGEITIDARSVTGLRSETRL